jgi:uncharacterized protein
VRPLVVSEGVRVFDRKPRGVVVALGIGAALVGALALGWVLDDLTAAADPTASAALLDASLAAMVPALLALTWWQRLRLPLQPVPRAGAVALVGIVAVQLLAAVMSGLGSRVAVGPLEAIATTAAVLGQSTAEELLFRCILPVAICWAWTRTARPPAWGFAVSAALFVPWHLPTTLAQAADHLLFAVVMTALLVLGRTIWLPIAAHLLTNVIAIAVPSATPALPVVLLEHALVLAVIACCFPAARVALAGGRPRDGSHRLRRFDALRGAALGVILVENALLYVPAEWRATGTTAVERLLRAAVTETIEFRGLPLFAMLIGFGLHSATRAAGEAGWARIRRRDRVLIALGALHGCAVFSGDILAVFGILLVMLVAALRRGWSPVRMLAVTAVLFVLQAAVAATGYGAVEGASSTSATSWEEASMLRVLEWAVYVVSTPLASSGLLCPVLVGLLVARMVHGEAARATWCTARVAVAGLTISGLLALPAAIDVTAAYGSGRDWTGILLLQLAGLLGAASLLVLTAAAGSRLEGARAVALLAPAGRATLSVYLGSSVVFLVVLSASGLDLGAGGVVPVMITAAVLFALVVTVARWRPAAVQPVERLVERWTRAPSPREAGRPERDAAVSGPRAG